MKMFKDLGFIELIEDGYGFIEWGVDFGKQFVWLDVWVMKWVKGMKNVQLKLKIIIVFNLFFMQK